MQLQEEAEMGLDALLAESPKLQAVIDDVLTDEVIGRYDIVLY